MTNIFGSPEKGAMRKWLFALGIEGLKADGWTVERVPGSGKSSIRKVTKEGIEKIATIRTSQDTWIAFPRTEDDSAWATLKDADIVVACSVNEKDDPKFAQVHIIDADDMRQRFDRLYAARREAGHTMKTRRGVWISLYGEDKPDPVYFVGAGAGRSNPPVLKRDLHTETDSEQTPEIQNDDQAPLELDDELLTIAQAKRRLAMTFGVSEEDISITING